MNGLRRAFLACCFITSVSVLAKAQNPSAATPPAPIVGAVDYLDELTAVVLTPGGGRKTYAIPVEDLARLHPAVVKGEGAKATVDQPAMSALLLALVKDLREQNLHLNSQLAHVIDDKADLERKLHELTVRFDDLEAALRAASVPALDQGPVSSVRQ